MSTGPDDSPVIRRVVGVYNADGSVRGELAYFVRARLGRAHCALCDITHGSVRERPDWKARKARLPVRFDTYHRDDQPGDVRQAHRGRVPVVLAEAGNALVVLLGPDELSACAGSGARFVEALESAANRAGLVWPSYDDR